MAVNPISAIWDEGDVFEGTYDGHAYRFQTMRDGEEGAGSIYGPAMDLVANRKVFLKKYIDPAPRTEWLPQFIDYHRKLRDRIAASNAAQQLVVSMDFFQDERNRFWQVIEFVDNSRDLKSYLQSSDTRWEQRVKFARVFMFAMRALHEDLKLVHGDLKPANLLLIPQGDNFRIKLIDFDRPVFLDEREIPWAATDGYLGSPGYFSPEHLKRQRPTDKSDVFTCGIILYQLLCRQGHPFSGETIPADYNGQAVPEPEFWGSFGTPEQDSEIARILRATLDPDPARRPTSAEVHQALIAQPIPVGISGTTGEGDPPPFVIPPQLQEESQRGAADIVFLLDSTGSMGPCIKALKEHIHSFIHSLVTGSSEAKVAPVPDWRARVVGYRNFADCNASNNAERWYRKLGGGGWLLNNPFTRDEAELHRQLDSLKAFGGGSGAQESLLDALMLVLKSGFVSRTQSAAGDALSPYRWRTNGVGRVVIVFTDAGYIPEMQYDFSRTRFEEKEVYPFDLVGGGLDELQNEIDAGSFKLYVFAPVIKDYTELGDIPKVIIMSSGDEGGGFMKTIENESGFTRLIEYIVKGVSISSSEFREMPME